jgi:hypothetical protein
MENVTKNKKYNTYTKKQVSQMRKALKTEEPRLVIAKRLSNEWGVLTRNVYQKLNGVARSKRTYTKRQPITTTVAKVTPAKGVVLTGDMLCILGLLKEPTKAVVYNTHTELYYN